MPNRGIQQDLRNIEAIPPEMEPPAMVNALILMLHNARATARQAGTTGRASRENDLQILVVEDEDLIRDVVVDILEGQGHEVLQAESGEQALQLCAEVAPDLIFTDVKLPGQISGWDVAIRCRQSHPAIPVIYATGYTQSDPRPVSGSIMLHKPYRLERLLESIRTLTRQ